LFAVLSASLFAIGVTGFVVSDSERQAAIVAELARRLPPLAELLKTGLDRVAGGAVQFSILGLAGLAWGTSRFYDNLDVAISRVFHGTPARRFASRTIRGFGVVALLVVAIVATVILASLASIVDSLLPRDSAFVRLVSAVAFAVTGLALYFASVAIVYRLVPPRPPTWRALGVPAMVVAAFYSVFTNVYVQIEGRLVGSLEIFAGFIVVLATMIWLSIGFQVLLLGAAWTRVRGEGPASS
jgi:uncharacterized BrkB/YihY/UPF0761 family membrane protein